MLQTHERAPATCRAAGSSGRISSGRGSTGDQDDREGSNIARDESSFTLPRVQERQGAVLLCVMVPQEDDMQCYVFQSATVLAATLLERCSWVSRSEDEVPWHAVVIDSHTLSTPDPLDAVIAERGDAWLFLGMSDCRPVDTPQQQC